MFKYISFLLVILSFSNCSTIKEEKEPNNSLSQSQRITLGDIIAGKISKRSDKDYYSLNVIGNKWINKALYISLEHNSTDDLAIDIYVENKLLKTVDNFASKNSRSGRKPLAKGEKVSEIFANLALYPASYNFVVRKSKQQYKKINVNYKISFLEEGRSDFSEKEPNDNLKSANLIDNNTTIEGFYSPGNNSLMNDSLEEDFFKVIFSVTNKTLFSVEVSGVPGIDATLSIYNELGLLVKKVNNAGLHRGEKISNIGIKKGTYYISLRALRLYNYNNKIPYSMRVETTSYRYGEELEPNDKLNEANPVKVDDKFEGLLASVSDKDFYSFIVPQPGSYMFSARLKDILNVNSAITIYNSSGKKIREFNSAGVGQAEYIANIGIKTTRYDEKYFIKVHSKKGFNDTDKYEMIISLFESSQQGEYEPNDTLNSSNGLINSIKKSGYIYPQKDIDWYSFILKENRNVSVTVKGADGLDLVLTIYNSKGKQIRVVNGSGLNESEKMNSDLSGPATYYLTLNSLKKNQFNVRNPYELFFKTFKPVKLPLGITKASNASPKTVIKTNGSNI